MCAGLSATCVRMIRTAVHKPNSCVHCSDAAAQTAPVAMLPPVCSASPAHTVPAALFLARTANCGGAQGCSGKPRRFNSGHTKSLLPTLPLPAPGLTHEWPRNVVNYPCPRRRPSRGPAGHVGTCLLAVAARRVLQIRSVQAVRLRVKMGARYGAC